MEKENKSFSLMFQCEDCKKHFPVTADQAPNSLKHKKEYVANGQSIFLTYYDCPECGKRHFVQIDDEYSLNKLKHVTAEFRKLTALRIRGKSISKKQSSKINGILS